jgi:hypothetical protein
MTALHLLLVVLALQGDPRPKDNRPVVIIRGCLEGSKLKVTSADTEGVTTRIYRLKIPKSLSGALKEHRGHEEELTGLLTDSSRRMGGGKTAKIGSRTKVSVGASEERTGGARPATDIPQLEVESFMHVASVCKR